MYTCKTPLRHSLCLLALLTAILACSTRGAGAQSPPMRGLAHIALRVADLERSRLFYQQLGFEQAFAADKDGKPTESFLKINDRQFIELYPQTGGKPLGFLHLCFEGQDLQALHDFYLAHGLPPTPVRKAGAGNLLFTMAGPEAQNIEYTQYMPGSKHTLDIGKHLGPERLATGISAVAVGFKDLPAARAFYLTKLGFRPSGKGPDLFAIPGGSRQHVLLEPLSPENRARVFLSVDNLKRTAFALKQRGIAFTPGKPGLIVVDPDGNLLVFTRR